MTERTDMEPRLMLGDCLDRMSEIEDGSVDMILADLPYGTTQNKWDAAIPFEPLWCEYWRVTKPGATLHLLCFADESPAAVSQDNLRTHLGQHWRITGIELFHYSAAVDEATRATPASRPGSSGSWKK
mgnify:CR=1 FL=1